MDGVLIAVLVMSSRSMIGRVFRMVASVGEEVHIVQVIDPEEPANMSTLIA